MAKSLIDRLIYFITKKPTFYVEVRNPPKTTAEKLMRPHDARQVQYNRWSKAHQRYSGSYLPYTGAELSKQGWSTEHSSSNSYETEHTKPATGQHVLRHGRHVNKHGVVEPTHYHWENPAAIDLSKSRRKPIYYLDKYGNECARGSNESHIKPHKTRRQK